MGMKVAIDGPAGAGKSTVARTVAQKLQFLYVDTGAMYRAIGLYLLRQGIAPDDLTKVKEVLPDITVTIDYDASQVQQVFLNGENVSSLIRTQEVGEAASKASSLPPVREKLLALQRNLAKTHDVVMDGRDIGTVILPNAEVKIYLTASVAERARRRCLEYAAKDMDADYEKIVEEIRARDYRDMTRETAPLKQAKDASLLDSSHMTIEEVTENILNQIQKARTEKN